MTISPRLGRGLLFALCCAILAANLAQAYVISPARSTQYGGLEQQFVRLGQTIAARGESKASFLLVNDPQSLYAPSLQQFLHMYYLPFELTELRALETTPTEAASDLLASNALVIISPRLPAEIRKAYEGFLTENADSHCEMRNLIGGYVFTVWYSKGIPRPCPP